MPSFISHRGSRPKFIYSFCCANPPKVFMGLGLLQMTLYSSMPFYLQDIHIYVEYAPRRRICGLHSMNKFSFIRNVGFPRGLYSYTKAIILNLKRKKKNRKINFCRKIRLSRHLRFSDSNLFSSAGKSPKDMH